MGVKETIKKKKRTQQVTSFVKQHLWQAEIWQSVWCDANTYMLPTHFFFFFII